MKKILLISLVTILMGCNQTNVPTANTEFTYSSHGLKIEGYTINEHLYIGHLHGDDWDWATHSGECPNITHKPIIMYTDTNNYHGQDTIN